MAILKCLLLQRIKLTAYGDNFPFLENESICCRPLFQILQITPQGPDVHLRIRRSGIG
jgi:hypothetical protein